MEKQKTVQVKIHQIRVLSFSSLIQDTNFKAHVATEFSVTNNPLKYSLQSNINLHHNISISLCNVRIEIYSGTLRKIQVRKNSGKRRCRTNPRKKKKKKHQVTFILLESMPMWLVGIYVFIQVIIKIRCTSGIIFL